jgi:hypothetical protein
MVQVVVRSVNEEEEGLFKAFVFKNKSMDGSEDLEDRVCPMDDKLWELKVSRSFGSKKLDWKIGSKI